MGSKPQVLRAGKPGLDSAPSWSGVLFFAAWAGVQNAGSETCPGAMGSHPVLRLTDPRLCPSRCRPRPGVPLLLAPGLCEEKPFSVAGWSPAQPPGSCPVKPTSAPGTSLLLRLHPLGRPDSVSAPHAGARSEPHTKCLRLRTAGARRPGYAVKRALLSGAALAAWPGENASTDG